MTVFYIFIQNSIERSGFIYAKNIFLPWTFLSHGTSYSRSGNHAEHKNRPRCISYHLSVIQYLYDLAFLILEILHWFFMLFLLS